MFYISTSNVVFYDKSNQKQKKVPLKRTQWSPIPSKESASHFRAKLSRTQEVDGEGKENKGSSALASDKGKSKQRWLFKLKLKTKQDAKRNGTKQRF